MAETEYQEQPSFQIVKKIEDYFLGKLSQIEIDALWITFLQQPIWLDYLETEVQLRSIIKKSCNS